MMLKSTTRAVRQKTTGKDQGDGTGPLGRGGSQQDVGVTQGKLGGGEKTAALNQYSTMSN